MTFSARPEPRVGSGRSTFTPLATYTLISLCVAVYIACLFIPGVLNQVFLNVQWARFEPWRILTSAFAHSINITHIAFNMLALFSLGMVLEPALGRARFVATYLLTAVGGSVAFMWSSSDQAAVVGASGAVFGLFGCLILLQRHSTGEISKPLLAMVAVNFVLGFIIPNVAWQAHVGGFLVGLACAALMTWDARRQAKGQAPLIWGVFIAMAVVLTALAMVRLNLSW